MHVILSDVSKGPNGRALQRTSIGFQRGEVTLVAAETERRPTVLGLIASGRMRPDTGDVTIDGRADATSLRRCVALVDAPDVSDPAADVTVGSVVAEELMFAGRIGTRRATRAMLARLGMTEQSAVPMADLAPAARIRLLTELATFRDGIQGLVLTAPDRHGGDPREWFAVAQDLAERGYAVLVIAGAAAVATLDADRGVAPAPSLQEGGDAA